MRENSLLNLNNFLLSSQVFNLGSISSDFSQENQDTNYIAHRGYSIEAPENTLCAFEKASQNGFDTIECDVQWSKDGVPVILHDDTINRTARKKDYLFFDTLFLPRKCSNLTYEQLLKYDFGSWFGEEYKNTNIPTFDEMLDCADDNDLNVYIEIKENDEFDKQKAQILIDKVKEANMEDKVSWISFSEDYLKIISELDSDARLGYLSKTETNDETIEILDDLKTDENEVFLDIKNTKIDSEASRLLEENGYEFEAWVVDDDETLNALLDLNCSAITTNKLLP